MCMDPITAMVLAGTALSVVGDLQQGAATAGAEHSNAVMAQAQAKARRNKAVAEADQAKRTYQRQTGHALAEIGATGLTLGSFSDVLADNAAEAALEQQIIKFNGEQEAAQLTAQADLHEQAGHDAKTASYFAAAGHVIGGIKGATLASNQTSQQTGSGVSFGNPFGG